MENFKSLAEDKLLNISNKISRQRYLLAIKNTFISLLPITIMGGLFAVISAAPITDTTKNGFLLAWASFVKNNSAIFSWVNTLTLGLMSLYVAIGITYYLCRHYKIDTLLPIMITSFGVMMLSMKPIKLTYDEKISSISYLDGKGLLVGMVVAIITVELYRFLRSKNFGRIKMPDSVPASLSETFASLSTAIAIMCLFTAVFVIFNSMNTTFAAWLSSIIAPKIKAADSLWFIILITIIINVAWFFGIHNAAFWGIMGPIMYMNLSLNSAAQTAGHKIPAILTESFWAYFVIIGGLGSCLSIAILLCFSKSKQMKTVGRIGIIPAFFGISEPITFGLPIMLNPFMFIPCFLTGTVNAIITFIAMSSNLIGKTYAMLSFNMPSIFGAYFSTGDFKASILVLILTIIDMVIYFPFYKLYERQQVKVEAGE